MDYQKVTLVLSPDNQLHRDILMSELGDLGFESFVENQNEIEAYIPAKEWNEAIMANLGLNNLFSVSWGAESIPDQNWNEVWEKNYFEPLLIAETCLIRAPFHKEFPRAKFEMIIEPKMAFGTGNHETTAMMAETILGLDLDGKEVLDMGCGTGILAMLASMKGAGKIVAIDIDQWAYESTMENSKLNQCFNIEARLGDASLLGDQPFDVIFANIHKNVLLNDMPGYETVLNPGGCLLMSGFYEEDMNDINQKASSLGLTLSHWVSRNKWTVAVYVKKARS